MAFAYCGYVLTRIWGVVINHTVYGRVFNDGEIVDSAAELGELSVGRHGEGRYYLG